MAEYVGVNPLNPDSLTDGPNNPTRQPYGDEFAPGDLMTQEDPEKVARSVVKLWTDQDRLHQRYLAECRANELRRRGEVNIKIVSENDTAEVTVIRWGGSMPVANKAARLCRKLKAVLFVDPPAPDVQPDSGDDDDGDRAEFAGRMLLDNNRERVEAAKMAFDKGSTYGSGYVWQYLDPKGERAPVEVEAHPAALSVDAPFTGPPIPQAPQVDPLTGAAIPLPPLPGQQLPPEESTVRFVMPDGQLTDTQGEAAQQWLPRTRREVLHGGQVRFLPATAVDRWDARAVMVASFVPWGTLRHQFPELANLPEDEQKKLWNWSPEKSRHLAPGSSKAEREAALSLEKDDALCFVLRLYYGACGDYPDGAYLVTVGEKYLAYRGEWSAEINGKKEALLIPVSQYKQWGEGTDHPQGVATMTLIGQGNEVRAAFLGTMLEHLDRLNRQKVFIPTSSLLSPAELANPDQRYYRVGAGGQPFYEEIPQFDRNLLEFADREDAEMDHDSAMEDTAQGLDSPNSQSGRAKYAVIAQAITQLSELKDNINRAYELDCAIELQLKRAYYTKPQLLQYGSKETGYKAKRWVGSDLGATKDVKVKAGTMTLMAPLVKAEVAMQWGGPSENGAPPLIGPSELREIVSSNIGTLVGLQDEPQRVRIRRQLAAWEEGPPQGWMPLPPVPQVTGVDQMGQPVASMVPQPDPVLGPMWEPTLADELPTVAVIRLEELSKAMAGQKYLRFPPGWRMPVDMEFQRMRQMAGVMTVPEQQQAQAMAQQQQAEQGATEHQRGMEADANREQAKAQAASQGQAA